MIFNQDVHEFQVGTVLIKDGESHVVLAITGSKTHEPSVAITPIGEYANINTFVAGRSIWGTVTLKIPDAVDFYDLRHTWVEKNTGKTYDAGGNLRVWWRLRQDLQVGPFIMVDDSGYGIDSNPIIAPAERPDLTSANPGGGGHIQNFSNYFDGVFANPVGDQIDIYANGNGLNWNDLVGSESSGKEMSISFWCRPNTTAGWNANSVLLKFGGGAWSSAGGFRAICTGPTAAGQSTFTLMWTDVPAGNIDGRVWLQAADAPTWGTTDWHHVVFTRSGDVINSSGSPNPYKLYLDGVEYPLQKSFVQLPVTIIVPAPGLNVADAYINQDHGTFVGDLADIAIWDTKLTKENVEAIYNASKDGVADGTIITGDCWFSVIERSTDHGEAIVQYQAIGADPLRVK